jgi:hypothetical protein
MSSWSTLVAFTGFHYQGADKLLSLRPHTEQRSIVAFWSAASGWGSFSMARSATQSRTEISLVEGTLPLRSIKLASSGSNHGVIQLDGEALRHTLTRDGGLVLFRLQEPLELTEGKTLVITI